MTVATYIHGTAVLAEHVSVLGAPLQAFGNSAEHGVATGAGQWLTGAPSVKAAGMTAVTGIALAPVCSDLRQQLAQEACTGTVIFGGGSFGAGTGSPVVIADDKPNFRPGRLPRDRQPV